MAGKEKKGLFKGLNRKPKSKKEWQEWHRKYALALLHDQLDRVLASPSKKNYVLSLFNKWEKKFREERTDEIIREFYCLEEGGNSAKVCGELREDHVNFIAQYIACALCNGTGKENIARIRNFLEMQTATNIRDRMSLTFYGGTPVYFSVYVDCLRDIDIADVFFITEFDNVIVHREMHKDWTKNIAKKFLEDLKRDILFDFSSAVIKSLLDYKYYLGSRDFEITIEASQEELKLKTLQCFPPSFIKRFHKP